MKLIAIIEFLRQRSHLIVLISYAILALLVVVDALPFIVDKEHAHTAAEHWPAFWALFGLLGCGLLVLVSKTFSHIFVARQDDYYRQSPSA